MRLLREMLGSHLSQSTPEQRAAEAAASRAKYREQLAKRCVEREEAPPPGEVSRHMERMGVPVRAIRAAMAARDEPPAVAAKHFIADRGATFLLMLGPPGVGKTTAAALVVKDLCERWAWNSQPTGAATEPVQWLEAVELTRVSAFDSVDQERVAELRNCKLLVLDDAGDEGTSIGRGIVAELLMHRHAKQRRTVVCANLTGDAFKARYGAAVADRIRQTGLIPSLAGKSLRERRVQP